jgi:hypothetical protein
MRIVCYSKEAFHFGNWIVPVLKWKEEKTFLILTIQNEAIPICASGGHQIYFSNFPLISMHLVSVDLSCWIDLQHTFSLPFLSYFQVYVCFFTILAHIFFLPPFVFAWFQEFAALVSRVWSVIFGVVTGRIPPP